MRRFSLLLLSLLLFIGVASLSLVTGAKEKKSSDQSASCQTCKKLFSYLNRTAVVEIRDLKGRKKSKDTVAMEEKVTEHVSRGCTGSAIAQNKKMLKECEVLTEGKDEAIVNKIMEWGREPESSDLFIDICNEVLGACPYTATITPEQTEKKKPKSEAPSKDDKGPVFRVVAATWLSQVVQEERDWVTFHYEEVNEVSKRLMTIMNLMATRLQPCSTLRMGSINVVRNDIPAPFGEFTKANTIALWKASNKYEPAFMKDVEESQGYIAAFSLLNFIFSAANHPDTKQCMSEIQSSMSEEEVTWLRDFNSAPKDEL